MELRVVGLDHPDAVTLVEAVQAEYVRRYGGQDSTPTEPAEFAPPRGVFLVGYLDGVAVASGGWRTLDEYPDAVEIKRMYVAPAARGRGHARAVLAELEQLAVRAGRRRVLLETGLAQPESMALYGSSGYARIDGYGYHRHAEDCICYGKVLDAGQPAPDGTRNGRVTGRDFSPAV